MENDAVVRPEDSRAKPSDTMDDMGFKVGRLWHGFLHLNWDCIARMQNVTFWLAFRTCSQ